MNRGDADPVAPPPSILVVVNRSSGTPWASYLLEILDIEGLVAREVVDIGTTPLDDVPLDDYEIVILASGAVTRPDDEATLRRRVRAGLNLIALRPPTTMADMFGLAAQTGPNTRLADSYLVIDEGHQAAADVAVRTLQFHGEADLYAPAGGAALARFAVRSTPPTRHPAVVTHRFGRGWTAAFAYDLAWSTVVFHQGRPDNCSVGSKPDADTDGRWTPNDLFVGCLDPGLKRVPQADIHQDLLVRLVNWMSARGTPVPRIWYFPNAARCVAFVNGDSDGMRRGDLDTVISTVERYGGSYTAYLMTAHHDLVKPAEADELRQRGHSFGQHVILPWDVSVADAADQVRRDMAGFEERFGYRPRTNRGHCLIWPGWTEMAELLAEQGVRMDQTFIPRRFLRYGYLNGSGLPVKFMAADGRLLDIYEQNTQLTDDGEIQPEKFLVPGHARDEVVANALDLLEDCRDRFHGVFQVAFHPRLTVDSGLWLLEAILGHCRASGIPMVGGERWVAFNDARRDVDFHDSEYDGRTGTYRVVVTAREALPGATIMLPARRPGRRLGEVRLDGQPSPWENRTIKGYAYALCVLDLAAGARVRLDATYTPSEGRPPRLE